MILIAKRTDGGISITKLPADESTHESFIFNATHYVPFDENDKAVRDEKGEFVWVQRSDYLSWHIADDSVIPENREDRDQWKFDEKTGQIYTE